MSDVNPETLKAAQAAVAKAAATLAAEGYDVAEVLLMMSITAAHLAQSYPRGRELAQHVKKQIEAIQRERAANANDYSTEECAMMERDEAGTIAAQRDQRKTILDPRSRTTKDASSN